MDRLLDPAALQIIAFFAAVAHGEGLAGQHAVSNNTAEQLALFHGGQQEADGVLLIGQTDQLVVVMDVVDIARLGSALISIGLERTCSSYF